jgi:carbonic anhydrase
MGSFKKWCKISVSIRHLESPIVKSLIHLLESNQAWAKQCLDQDPQYFDHLAHQQTPEYLWIGCSDSRVPANQIVGLAPGELFVHRNIANVVHATDYNCHSVLQYAVDILKVKHVIVCGHYGCGGVEAALGRRDNGLADTWLRQIKETYLTHENELNGYTSKTDKLARLCELNVQTQVDNLCKTKTLQYAWQRGQSVTVHGWIYSIFDGVIKDLQVSSDSINDVLPIFRMDAKE